MRRNNKRIVGSGKKKTANWYAVCEHFFAGFFFVLVESEEEVSLETRDDVNCRRLSFYTSFFVLISIDNSCGFPSETRSYTRLDPVISERFTEWVESRRMSKWILHKFERLKKSKNHAKKIIEAKMSQVHCQIVQVVYLKIAESFKSVINLNISKFKSANFDWSRIRSLKLSNFLKHSIKCHQ